MIQVEFYQGFTIGDEVYYYNKGKVLQGKILEITHFKCDTDTDATFVRIQPESKWKRNRKVCSVPFCHVFKSKELCKEYAKSPLTKQFEYWKAMSIDKF